MREHAPVHAQITGKLLPVIGNFDHSVLLFAFLDAQIFQYFFSGISGREHINFIEISDIFIGDKLKEPFLYGKPDALLQCSRLPDLPVIKEPDLCLLAAVGSIWADSAGRAYNIRSQKIRNGQFLYQVLRPW